MIDFATHIKNIILVLKLYTILFKDSLMKALKTLFKVNIIIDSLFDQSSSELLIIKNHKAISTI